MSRLKSSLGDSWFTRWGWLVAVTIFVIGGGFRLFREIQVIQSVPVNAWTQDVTADCAVVLTGGPHRIREGLDLLYERKVKKLVISGVHREVKIQELLPPRLWPFYSEIDEQDVILEKRSETTWGNAQQSLPIVEALQCRDFVLVTSRLHMWRAYRTFRAVFPDYFEIQTRAVVGNRYETGLWDLLVESVKSLFYSLWAY